MNDVRYRICPTCRGEYAPTMGRCIDCDVELVWEGDPLPEEPEPEELPPVSELACVRVAPLAWIRTLSGDLQEHGIAHRIERAREQDAPEGQRPGVFGSVALFGVWVPEAALAEAQELDGTIAARLLPEEAPALEDGEDEACPACGAALVGDATECGDCGLVLG